VADIDLTPTEEMAANAKRGLELRRKHGRGGTAVGVARARDISNRKTLSPETVRRMHAFFSRHEKNKAGGEDDAGYIAWLLWGGDSGQSWAKRKVDQMNKQENGMSDTYKAIAERLGSAARNDRPGAKTRFGMTNAGYKALVDAIRVYGESAPAAVVAQAKQMKQEPTEFTDNEVMAVIAKMKQSRASRPGAKAKMGMTNAGYKMLIEAIRKHGASAPANVVERAREMKADPTEFTDNEVMAVIAKMKQSRASRLGAKATFGIAQVWLTQTESGRETARKIRANLHLRPSLSDRDLDRAFTMLMNLYDRQDRDTSELRQYAAEWKKFNSSRPGAKATMARWEATQTKKHGKPITEHTAKIDGVSYMIEQPDAMGTMATLYMWNDNRGMERIATGDVAALKTRAEGMRKKEARGVAAIERLANYSRPGAKDTNAVREGCKISAEDEACLKMMAAADEKVSEKIRTLIAEGKPQKQAVAIALDLKRRGEL
jgi:hypothetical protein